MDKKLEKMWEDFADIPINENDEIELDFHQFKKGTNRFEIWDWFGKNHSKGLAYLLNLPY